MITIRQLKYFDALARFQHFGKAADSVAISQPALSMQIKEMEEILGVTLIERSSKGVQLTSEGEEIARRGKIILGAAQDLLDFARHCAEPLTGPLRLGVIPSVAPYILPKALPALHDTFPELELRLRETQTNVLLDELDRSELDVLLLALPVQHSDIETVELFRDDFLLAVQAKSDAARSDRSAEEIAKTDNLLLLEEGHCLRDQALNYCGNVGDDSLSRFGASSLSTITQMVANGYGVTLLPEMCLELEVRDDRIKLMEFKDPKPHRTIGLAWRSSSPRAEEFQSLGKVFAETALRKAELADA